MQKNIYHINMLRIIFSVITGFNIIATLILILRQLLPFLGETVITSSVIFSIFMASWYYGSTKIYNYSSLNQNFKIVATILGICGSYVFLAYLDAIMYKAYNLVATNFSPGNLKFWTLAITFLSITIIPIGYHLGKSKLTLNYANISGMLVAAIVVPVVLMKLYGIATSIFIITLLWLLLGLITDSIPIFTSKEQFIMFNYPDIFSLLLTYALIILSCYYVNIGLEHKFFIKTNTYANYAIKINQANNSKIFSINQSPSSQLELTTSQGFKYIEYIKNILFNDLKLMDEKILVLGAGGFSLTTSEIPPNHITYIDLDPELPKIVHEFFNKKVNYSYQAVDAAIFVRTAKHKNEKYKVVISDAYSTKHIIPQHLLDLTYINDIKAILEPQGIAIFNIIAKANLTDDYSKNIDHTIRNVFNSCMVIPTDYLEDQVTNILYFCRSNINV